MEDILLDIIRNKFFSPENRLINGAMNSEEYQEAKQLQVDFDKISELEGGRRTEGYVPDWKNSKSGVTIGTGVDLGAKTKDYFKGFDNPGILEKMEPYFGMQGQEAYYYEQENPFSLTYDEATLVDEFVKGKEMQGIESNFARTYGSNLADLPPELQTVIASVGYQYGPGFMDDPTTEEYDPKTPKFSGLLQMVSKDPNNIENYYNIANELRNFGDRYKTRRGKEAELIEQYISRIEGMR